MPFALPKLPYSYDALEPYIDAKTMELHHTKHHQTYLDKLNAALEKYPDWAAKSIEAILRDLNSVPDDIRVPVRNHGGGYANHNLFWTIMSPDGGGEPTGALADDIATAFSSFENFKKQFTETATSRFGSGWAWLVKQADKSLTIIDTPNQNSPLSAGHTPLLGLDVWEHAYYLKYFWNRAEYIEAFWNIVNWQEVQRRYEETHA